MATHEISRRAALIAAATAVTAGCAARLAAPTPVAERDPAPPHQPGVIHPPVPQPHCRVVVADFAGRAEPAKVVAALGDHLSAVDPGTTVTVGLGSSFVRTLGGGLPGAEDLPRFAREEIEPAARGGDLVLQVCAPSAADVDRAAARLLDGALTVRWEQSGFRGPSQPDGTTRNPLGFLDGTVNPRSAAEMDRDVWIRNGPASGGTIMVVRRIRLDVARFTGLPDDAQERVVGRSKDTGEPLSGGGPGAEVDLRAKHDDGTYRIPSDAHVRVSHSLASGVGMMLRRPYAYRNGGDDQGLLFVSFQNDLRTFVNTQHRLDEGDALMSFATTTASGAFLVLPAATGTSPLGATVFGR